MDSSPSEAIRHMTLLMELFKRVLLDKVDAFKETKDATEFRQGIIYLRKNLQVFEEIFDVAHQDAETAEEYQQLEALAKELGEARELICKANSVLKDIS